MTGELLPGNIRMKKLPNGPEDTEAEEKEPEQESQAFVDWMENFFARHLELVRRPVQLKPT